MTPIVQTSLLLALLGQAPSPETFDAEQAKRFLELYQKQAAQYEIYLGEDTKLETNVKPVFRFVRPPPGNHNGTLFVWTHDGRAEVI